MQNALDSTPTAQMQHTVKDFYRLVSDGQKADLIGGAIHMASPDSVENDAINVFLISLMKVYVDYKKLGRVSGSRFAYLLNEYNAPEPDIAFVRRERLDMIHKTGMRGAPDLAVEIVAEESQERDYEVKKHLYEVAGVQEYWIIDPLGMNAEFYRRVDGKFEPMRLEAGDIFKSEILDGFWLNVNWLFANPMPSAYEKLQEILGRGV
jgi:Uma2 family endonuclease